MFVESSAVVLADAVGPNRPQESKIFVQQGKLDGSVADSRRLGEPGASRRITRAVSQTSRPRRGEEQGQDSRDPQGDHKQGRGQDGNARA